MTTEEMAKRAGELRSILEENFEEDESDKWDLKLLDSFLSEIYQFLHELEA